MMKHLWENLSKDNSSDNHSAEFLKNSYLFKDLKKKEIDTLLEILHMRDFRPGETIFKQDDPGVGMYLIFCGKVDIVRFDPRVSEGEEKKEVFITRLNEGDFFGELSLVEDPSYRSAKAIAVERCHLIGFFKPELLQVIDRNPRTGTKILFRLSEILGKRLRETTESLTEIVLELNSNGPQKEVKARSEKHFTS